eukprot:GHRR01001573.1.p1 GENE.GHRR01001573.1~~GHRR01001573.1.p1  ORF type:complete len:162 (+),score=43.04 GHRR01001573.1:108-593(+)
MALRQLAANASCRWGLRAQAAPAVADWAASFSRAFASVLPELKYASSHEWAKADGDVATIGISDHAQGELGDVVYVELPELGSTVAKGETFGVVESVKAASDVYAPISGEVVEINQALVDEPAKVNSAPYGDGWMIKVKMSNSSELGELLDSAAYEKHCEH